ncbi:MAG: cyclase family protein [Bryobacterales bacterium]
MSGIVDLSYPIEDHFRWKVQRSLASSFDGGGQFQATWLGSGVHGFTHVDAPRHILPDGPTTSELALDALVGEAAVLDLSDVGPGAAIDAGMLAGRGEHLRKRDRILIRTDWDKHRSLHVPEFWSEAPYLTRDACEWLMSFEPLLIGFDFPQDEPIRGLLDGRTAPLEEFVSHDVLLRQGVILVEYLCNLGQIHQDRTRIVVLPLRVLGADGAPARAIAESAI